VTDFEALGVLENMAGQGMRIVLGLGIFGTTIDIIKSIYKMVTQK